MTGELPLIEKGLLTRDRRNGDRREPGGRDLLESPGHQLGFEERQAPLKAVGAASRNLRHTRKVAPVVLLDQSNMVERLEPELRRLADRADDLIGALVRTDRGAFIWDSGKLKHESLESRFLTGELFFESGGASAGLLGPATELRLLLFSRLWELCADRIALGTERFDLRLQRAHLRVERQEVVQTERNALVADRTLDRLAVRLDEIQCQHGARA